MRTSGAALVVVLVAAGCRDDARHPPLPPSRLPPSPPSLEEPLVEDASTGLPQVARVWARTTQKAVSEIAFVDSDTLAWAQFDSLDVQLASLAPQTGAEPAPRPRIHAADGPGTSGDSVTGLAAGPGVVITAASGGIRTWDAATGAPLHELLPQDGRRLTRGLVRLSDGSVIASMLANTTGGDDTIDLRRWSADGAAMFASKLPHTIRMGFGGIAGAALSPDGKTILTGIDWTVTYDARTGAETGKPFGEDLPIQGGDALIQAVAWPAGGPVVFSATRAFTPATPSLEIARRHAPAVDFAGHRGELQAGAFLPDGRLVTAGHEDQLVIVRDARGEPRCQLAGSFGSVWSLAVSGDGALVAVGTRGEVQVWNVTACR